MSSCPENDIHSIYVDGELPEMYLKEYEEHLKSCESCRKKVEKLQEISKILKNDSAKTVLNEFFLEKSFNDLQTKLSYAKNIKRRTILPDTSKLIVSFSAAAAVFALIFTPIHIVNRTSPVNAGSQLKPIARTSIQPVSEQDIVIDGKLDQLAISKTLGTVKEESEETVSSAENLQQAESSYQQNQRVVSATSLASSGGNSRFTRRLNAIDIFCPDFSDTE